MYGPSDMLARTRRVYRTDGLLSLCRQAGAYLLSRLFDYQTYYLSVARTDDVPDLDDGSFMPRADDFTLKVVRTNEEADELEARGFEFRSSSLDSRERLDKGAIASCLFLGRQLGHIGWAATTREAKDSLHEPPLEMEFSGTEGYRGATWTDPRCRRMRLGIYTMLEGRRLLRDSGVTLVRTAIAKKNVPTQRMMVKFSPIFYGEGRYLRILWWKQWREKPLSPDFNMSDTIR